MPEVFIYVISFNSHKNCELGIIISVLEVRNPRQRERDLPKGLGRDLNSDLCDFRVGTLLYCLLSLQ